MAVRIAGCSGVGASVSMTTLSGTSARNISSAPTPIILNDVHHDNSESFWRASDTILHKYLVINILRAIFKNCKTLSLTLFPLHKERDFHGIPTVSEFKRYN